MASIKVTAYMPELDMATLELGFEELENKIKVLEEAEQLKYSWTEREIDTEDILESFEYKLKKGRTVIRFVDERPPILLREVFEDFLKRKEEIITHHILLSTGAFSIEYEEETEETPADNDPV